MEKIAVQFIHMCIEPEHACIDYARCAAKRRIVLTADVY
jgi:hypothetical protein